MKPMPCGVACRRQVFTGRPQWRHQPSSSSSSSSFSSFLFFRSFRLLVPFLLLRVFLFFFFSSVEEKLKRKRFGLLGQPLVNGRQWRHLPTPVVPLWHPTTYHPPSSVESHWPNSSFDFDPIPHSVPHRPT